MTKEVPMRDTTEKNREDDFVRTWSNEMLNEVFTLASEKKLPENLMLNGVGMAITFGDGSKVTVNFNFCLVKGGRA